MKKNLFILLFIGLTSISVEAQKLKLGVKLGINGTEITNPNSFSDFVDKGFSESIKDTDISLGAGYQIGAFLRIYPKEKFFIQPELNYAMKKGETSFVVEGSTSGSTSQHVNQEVEFKNIEIPVMFGYRLLNLKLVQLNVMTGPLIAISTNKSNSFKGAVTELEDAGNNYQDKLKNAHYSWQIGASLDVLSFVLDLRYEKGLSEIADGSLGQKSNVYLLSVGYKF